jgi:hypothetical protein
MSESSSASGVLLIIAGVWLGLQTLAGGLTEWLTSLGKSSSGSSASAGPIGPGVAAVAAGAGAFLGNNQAGVTGTANSATAPSAAGSAYQPAYPSGGLRTA